MNIEASLVRDSNSSLVTSGEKQETFEGIAQQFWCKAVIALCHFPQLELIYEQTLDLQKGSEAFSQEKPQAEKRRNAPTDPDLHKLGWTERVPYKYRAIPAANRRNPKQQISHSITGEKTQLTPEGKAWYEKAKQWIATFYEHVPNTSLRLPDDFPPQINLLSSGAFATSRLQFLWILLFVKQITKGQLRQLHIRDIRGICNTFRAFVQTDKNTITRTPQGEEIVNHLFRPLWEEAKKMPRAILAEASWYEVKIPHDEAE